MISMRLQLTAVGAAVLLSACGGTDTPTEEARIQDTLIFTPAAAFSTASTFTAMASDLSDVTAMSTTSRWAGVLNGAAYQVEVPANWNGTFHATSK
jgi:hypothetical protein